MLNPNFKNMNLIMCPQCGTIYSRLWCPYCKIDRSQNSVEKKKLPEITVSFKNRVNKKLPLYEKQP